ncbi:enolase C-terminal domain-like protein [Oceaniglobus trochenteri]|uniref:enolase C-terminal domain-like protein n=1 Tax=Oceaniglobus trochenteri TaxID=2763260 RepID=UPI001CFFC2EF|nr:enolase C-terminal domain-like protein [Oceaniglobus trochenteri]
MTDHMHLTGDDRRIGDIRVTVANISEKSNWIFVELVLEDGATGTGEATLHGYEPLVTGWFDTYRPALCGLTLDALAARLTPGKVTPAGLVGHSAISALEQARLDLVAQAAGKPLCALYGRAGAKVPVYANINRGLPDRRPETFAARAAEVAAAGFARIKIAPFDGVAPKAGDGAANEALVQAGMDRIRAVRDAIGGQTGLMVDCHWRFGHDRARALMDELRPSGLYWIECPIAEIPAQFANLADLRKAANHAGMLLAGAEMGMGLEAFAPFIALNDVIMPDVKYCGGPAEMLRIADAAAEHGTRIAPHNPSGPVSAAHSVHLAAHPAIDLLELQHGETPLFDGILSRGHVRPEGGCLSAHTAPGLGSVLDRAVCAVHPWRSVPPPR